MYFELVSSQSINVRVIAKRIEYLKSGKDVYVYRSPTSAKNYVN